ncbi:DUF6714 family protein [Bradyrhizobium sp.]|uniref:DUF6714 family protein n=1 Tax=Bradyrhizobium sp. TaxID=376 RepID=UPI001EC8921E|nr:DUF6714 family protein [Bradyrhizobium sp.]MBV8894790.1 hypothetical protein [Acidobacteriota bacterium]MBV8918707.1 hypothetical protein [Bradyrhizobium sp.]MBV9985194.1 hypothetical protein [Bradyrhizobium sp.]
MTADQLCELLRASFPVEPLPEFFWRAGAEQPPGDIPDELQKRLANRPWIDVTMRDWTMMGAPAWLARIYLDPDTFRYYLPSLLVGVLHDTGYIDWALECLLPAGRKRRTERKEWTEFWDGLSDKQRDAIRAYLTGIRSMLGNPTDPADQHLHLLDDAALIWGLSGR